MLDRIARVLRAAATTGLDRVRLSLAPDGLGEVRVDIRRRGEAVDLVFRAREPQTRELLASRAEALRSALAAHGLEVGRLEFLPPTGSGAEEASARQGQGPRDPWRRPGGESGRPVEGGGPRPLEGAALDGVAGARPGRETLARRGRLDLVA